MKRVTVKKLSTNEVLTFKSVDECKKALGISAITFSLWEARGTSKSLKLTDYELVSVVEVPAEQKKSDEVSKEKRKELERQRKSEAHKRPIVLLDNKTHKKHKFNSQEECYTFLGVSKNNFTSFVKGRSIPKKLKQYSIIK